MTGDQNGGSNGGDQPPVRPGGDDEPQLDVDSAFAAIVAGWAAEAPERVGRWPASEDVEAGAPESAAETAPARDPEPDEPVIVPVYGAVATGPRDVDPELTERAEQAERDEGYVPPEPPPIPRGDLLTRLLWAGTIGGPLFLLIAAVAWRDAPDLFIGLAVAAFIGGFVTLVVRMPHNRSDDDDNGAVV